MKKTSTVIRSTTAALTACLATMILWLKVDSALAEEPLSAHPSFFPCSEWTPKSKVTNPKIPIEIFAWATSLYPAKTPIVINVVLFNKSNESFTDAWPNYPSEEFEVRATAEDGRNFPVTVFDEYKRDPYLPTPGNSDLIEPNKWTDRRFLIQGLEPGSYKLSIAPVFYQRPDGKPVEKILPIEISAEPSLKNQRETDVLFQCRAGDFSKIKGDLKRRAEDQFGALTPVFDQLLKDLSSDDFSIAMNATQALLAAQAWPSGSKKTVELALKYQSSKSDSDLKTQYLLSKMKELHGLTYR